MLLLLLTILSIVVPVLITIAFFTLAERQVMASMQRRIGPNVSGFGGILQPFYDGAKLGLKEPILPEISASGAFAVAPMTTFILSQLSYCGIFINDSPYQALVLFVLSGLGVYGVLLAGWSSNTKYSLLGMVRASSLMISYELVFGAVLLTLALSMVDSTGMKSLNFSSFNASSCAEGTDTGIILAFVPLLLIFIVCSLAETNRIPFDLAESEAELVAGYNVEYSSLGFALFFIGEYGSMMSMAVLTTIFFFGGFHFIGIVVFMFLYIWIRGTLPRYRYDMFMRLSYKSLFPLSLALFSMFAAFDYITTTQIVA